MTESHDFEGDLRTMLVDTAEHTSEPDGLAERLITGAATPTRTPHRVRTIGSRRWLPPLLAAAIVIAVAAGSAAVVSVVQSQRHVPPAHPSPSQPPTAPAPTPAPSHSASSHPSAEQAPTHTAAGKPVPAGFTATDVTFVDAEHGWAIGDGACPTGTAQCAAILRTDDGGQKWAAVSAPPGVTPAHDYGSCGTNGELNGPCVNSLAFADPLHGYAWGFHSFFMTSDGGTTWTGDGQPRAVQLVIAGGTAFRLVALHDCSAQCEGRLEAAPVGSSTWSDVTPGSTVPMVSGYDLAAAGNAVYFMSVALGPNFDPQRLFRSTDGGQSWTSGATNPCGNAVLVRELAPASDGSVTVGCGSYEGGDGDVLRTSIDGGAIFGAPLAVPLAPKPWATPCGSMAARSSTRFACSVLIRSAAGSVTGYEIHLTSDGGASWTRVASPAESVVGASGQGFPGGGSFGYRAIGAGTAVLITNDGGQTWSARGFG